MYDQLFEYNTFKESWSYFNLDSLLDCTLYVYNNDTLKKDLAEECLYSFYDKMYLAEKAKGKGVSPYNGVHYKILTSWNTVRSFKICMQFCSVNDKDIWGGDECSNRSVRFINLVLLPKINSINNVTSDQFYIDLIKHLDPEQNFESDCFDSVYKIVYPALKQAWEEGKIELRSID